MLQVRASVEWSFGDIITYLNFLDFKKNLKICLSAVVKMYVTCNLYVTCTVSEYSEYLKIATIR
jgi:hypothetical protein